MRISNKGHLIWGNNIPNKKRFAASMSGPWHDTMQSSDIYGCDWNYATGTWGAPYKMVGIDGRPGSDGDPKGYLQSIKITEINQSSVKSALIEGAVIRGGRLESETDIDVTRDARIGNNLYLGQFMSGGRKTIAFNDGARISSYNDGMTISAQELQMLGITSIDMGTGIVDFSNLENINWGKNAPVAVFGGDEE